MNLFGNELASMATGNVLLMVCIVTAASVFLSEVMSNVAQVIVMAPVVSSMAASLHMDPLMLGIPMTLGASCASMLPMGTPPNAIVFASSHIKMKNMIFAGFVLNIVSIILIVLFCYFLQPVIIKTIFHFH
jgi:sodium-dependent dicarboxylate transporter 2/3/5